MIYILTAGCFFPSQVEAWPRWATSGRLRGQNSTRFPTKLGQDFLPPDSTIFRNLFNFPAGPSPGTTSHHFDLEIDFAWWTWIWANITIIVLMRFRPWLMALEPFLFVCSPSSFWPVRNFIFGLLRAIKYVLKKNRARTFAEAFCPQFQFWVETEEYLGQNFIFATNGCFFPNFIFCLTIGYLGQNFTSFLPQFHFWLGYLGQNFILRRMAVSCPISWSTATSFVATCPANMSQRDPCIKYKIQNTICVVMETSKSKLKLIRMYKTTKY